ncbi:Bacterial transcriptional activator domain-containing protein [Pararobbsia alpina]|uniref:BTAD domain-containing putative transcriptional regulator n=1 Tax=Pararobbsia alpina TaxID=621374 RepID=UPI0039A73EF4
MSQSAPTVSLYLLGPPRIERAGSVAALKYNRARGLLAYLALEPGFHTRDSLAELFWPNEPTTQGRDKLKRMLFELREALGERAIEGDRYVVRLAPLSTVWVDAIAFEADTDPVIPLPNGASAPGMGSGSGSASGTGSRKEPASGPGSTAYPGSGPASGASSSSSTSGVPNTAGMAGTSGTPATSGTSGTDSDSDKAARGWRDALDRCEHAVELYRGPLLQGLRIDDAPDFEIWLDGQREAYVRRLVLALSRLARGRAHEGRPVDAIHHARRLVDIAPHHEPGWQLLIDLLVQSGRRDEAIHELERCRRALARELDAEPHPATLALIERDAPVTRVAAIRGVVEVPQSVGSPASGSSMLPLQDSASRDAPAASRGLRDRPPPGGPAARDGAVSPASVPRAHARLAMGVAHLVHGRMPKALAAFEATLAAQPDSIVDVTFGADARAMAWSLLSVTQWRMGHPDAAIDASERALERARRVREPHTLAYALLTAGVLSQLRGDPDRTLAHTSDLLELVEEHRMPNWRLAATALSGWAIAALGDPDAMSDAEAAAHALSDTMGSVGSMLLGLLRDRES